jgi:acyl-CoA synthetase (AMP-forming)/AMP-acid ligase II
VNARYRLLDDLGKITAFIRTKLGGNVRERRDVLNTFYILESAAREHPDRVFIIYQGKQWTYKESYVKALRYGTWLKTKFGVSSGEVVALDCMNSDTFVWIWFGLWAIGAKPAFINYNLRGEGLAHCIRTSGSRVLLVDEETFDAWDDNTRTMLGKPDFVTLETKEDQDDEQSEKIAESRPLEIVNLTSTLLQTIETTIIPSREPNSARGNQLLKSMAALIYTSGTTGLPKPAVVAWGKCTVAPALFASLLKIKPDDIFYTCMPLYHSSAALLGLCSALAAGCTFSIGRRFNREQFWKDVRESQATIIQYVGETCRYLLTLPPSELDTQHNVRLAFGNGLRPDVWPRFKQRFAIPDIVEFYAATEGPSALFNYSRNSFTEGAVGITGPLMASLLGATATVVKVDRNDGNILWRSPDTGFCAKALPDEPGELLYKLIVDDIQANFQGYYKNGGATNKKILRNVLETGDAYFSTGDIMRKDVEGRWYFCDRVGDTFRWKSENVSTSEVSEVLGRSSNPLDGHALLEEANVYGVEVPGFDGRAGCAAIVLSETHQAKFEATNSVEGEVLRLLAKQAVENLPRYAVPVFLRVQRTEGANERRTGTNKQQKHVLREDGVDPGKIGVSGDALYWLKPGSDAYEAFAEKDWQMLNGGLVKL